MKKILFIGAINEFNQAQGGEEYKNQLILNKLKSEQIELKYFDTFRWRKSPFLLFRLLMCLFFSTYNCIIISASSVSTYRFLKLIYLVRPNALSRIVYIVIGGYFPEGIKSGRFKSKVYNNLKVLIVEGEYLRNQLLGFIEESRVKVIPNFKNLKFTLNGSHNSNLC